MPRGINRQDLYQERIKFPVPLIHTYYDDVDGADQFEKHVTHFYDFIGDRLIIGKFCAIAKVKEGKKYLKK